MKWLFLTGVLFTCLNGFAGEAEIIKVLPHLIDSKGRHTLSPSLYERDAYQVYLRENPEEISALRFDVQWKSGGRKKPLLLKVEMRGSKSNVGTRHVVEEEVKPASFGAKWSTVTIDRKSYDVVGQIVAWKATLWDGEEEIAQQESFLW